MTALHHQKGLLVNLAVHIGAFVVGLVLFVLTAASVVTSMLIPRPRRSLLSHMANTVANRFIRWTATQTRSQKRADAVMALTGPLSILSQLVVYVISFLIAFALMIFAVDNLSTSNSLYQSGATLLTLGIVAPVNTAQVILTFVAALTGLTLIAILVGYLLSLYAAYSDRSQGLAQLSQLTGEPAWAPEFVCRSKFLANLADPGANCPNLAPWTDWISQIHVNQDGNAVLNHFRSGSAHRSWLVGILVLLDTAALEITTLKSTPAIRAQAVLLLAEGIETLTALVEQAGYRGNELSRYHPDTNIAQHLPSNLSEEMQAVLTASLADSQAACYFPHANTGAATKWTDPGISEADFYLAWQLFIHADIALVESRQQAWADFANLRSAYFCSFELLAKQLLVVPAPWTYTSKFATVWPTLTAAVRARESTAAFLKRLQQESSADANS